MRTLLCRLAAFVALSAVVAPVAAQAQESLDPIIVGIQVKTTPIAVQSSDAQLQALLTTAFGAHGAYKLVAQDQAGFVIRIDPSGQNGAKLDILGGRPLQSQFSQQVTGSSTKNAALRAADIAVTKTSGEPGFFAGKIAFIGEREGATELYVSDLFFQEVRRMTNDRAKCVQPALSPDGRTVLYTSYQRNGFPDIYSINMATGRRESFLSFSGVNTGSKFSPNGSRVAVVLSGTGNAEIYTVGADSKNMKRLTRNKSIESDPSFSPDGSKLVFASDAATTNKPQLFQVSASGGEPQRIATDISGYCAEPAWNPRKENLIAFTIAQGGEFEVALYDSSARKSVTLTRGAGDAVEPCWTRDGRHLIYTERAPNARRLVLLDTESGKKTYLHDARWGQASQADYSYGQ